MASFLADSVLCVIQEINQCSCFEVVFFFFYVVVIVQEHHVAVMHGKCKSLLMFTPHTWPNKLSTCERGYKTLGLGSCCNLSYSHLAKKNNVKYADLLPKGWEHTKPNLTQTLITTEIHSISYELEQNTAISLVKERRNCMLQTTTFLTYSHS